MKPITSILALFVLINQMYGQIDTTTIYKNLESKKFYSVNIYSENQKGETVYKVNGKIVSKSTYDKYKSKWKNINNCCPCILESYDEDENLISEAVSCTDCRVGWFKTYYKNGNIELAGKYKENPTGNWDDIWNRGYCSVPDGKWTYFSEDGDTLYSEFWNNGVFIKQIPEQNKVEIWDIKVQFKGQDIKTCTIPIAKIGKLTIQPKYKNSNIDSKIKIEFEVSANGHKMNKKEFSLQSFKKIDVSEMLSEVGIPKDKKTSFLLNVYSEGKVIRSFYLNVKNK